MAKSAKKTAGTKAGKAAAKSPKKVAAPKVAKKSAPVKATTKVAPAKVKAAKTTTKSAKRPVATKAVTAKKSTKAAPATKAKTIPAKPKTTVSRKPATSTAAKAQAKAASKPSASKAASVKKPAAKAAKKASTKKVATKKASEASAKASARVAEAVGDNIEIKADAATKPSTPAVVGSRLSFLAGKPGSDGSDDAAFEDKPRLETTKLATKDLDKFRHLLLMHRRQLLGDIEGMEKEALQPEGGNLSTLPVHMADVGTDSYEQEFTLDLADRGRRVIDEIDHALGKIDDATYGICEGTGQMISKTRLEARPWTRYSIEFARQRERRSGRR